MTATFVSVAGTVPQGADVLREHLRWTDAERRWRVLPAASCITTQPSPISPPARAALRDGARLHSFTNVCAGFTGAATRNQV
ncbi:hypothetical protein [Azospirillum sp. TSO22-1]|uniref:hypothetical protein n=1 Tax=Azospirillum sp. TSO22-1 TaxID=716789 RepID=UPI000D65B1CA|nr:hypothetical protein [Azospirillum sp. TSO22-1]